MNPKPQLTEVAQIIDEQQTEPSSRGIWGLFAELRKRKVCRTAISYMLVMWLNLQIGDVIFPMIGLPDWSLSLIIVIGVMGFPVVLILAWAFQVTPDGIVLDDDGVPETPTEKTLDTVVNLLLLVFSITLSILLLLQFFAEERTSLLATSPETPQVVVVSTLSFEPAAEGKASRAMAMRIHEELRHLLINLDGVDVLPEITVMAPEDQRRRLALTGSLLLEGQSAHVHAHLVDVSAGRYLMSITFNVEVESSITFETAVAKRIVDEIVAQIMNPIGATPEPVS